METMSGMFGIANARGYLKLAMDEFNEESR